MKYKTYGSAKTVERTGIDCSPRRAGFITRRGFGQFIPMLIGREKNLKKILE